MQSRAGRAHDFSKALYNPGLFRLDGEPGCPQDNHHHRGGDARHPKTAVIPLGIDSIRAWLTSFTSTQVMALMNFGITLDLLINFVIIAVTKFSGYPGSLSSESGRFSFFQF
jgi:hypothetical protein